MIRNSLPPHHTTSHHCRRASIAQEHQAPHQYTWIETQLPIIVCENEVWRRWAKLKTSYFRCTKNKVQARKTSDGFLVRGSNRFVGLLDVAMFAACGVKEYCPLKRCLAKDWNKSLVIVFFFVLWVYKRAQRDDSMGWLCCWSVLFTRSGVHHTHVVTRCFSWLRRFLPHHHLAYRLRGYAATPPKLRRK